MAAYAAVTSLMGTVHLIYLQEGRIEHLALLYDKVGSLLEFLDNSDNEPMKDLHRKVKNLANEVEDKVESHIGKEGHNTLFKILQLVFPTQAHKRLLMMLQRATKDIDSMKEDLVKLKEKNNMRAGNRSLHGSSSPRSHVSTLENNMVGYNDEQASMQDQLTGHSSQLEVISIAGMGGIGKSTFAKKMFSDPSIVSFFDVLGWITVSEDYSLREMLLSLLQDCTGVKAIPDNVSDAELADRLQKSLKGRRYLIVVDDIWSMKAWDDIRLCFPENNNRSRILLTTRDMNLAQYASSPNDPFLMRFLEPDESWNLFCQKAFGEKNCPTEFGYVAKEVLENCKGLPLMISVVAGTLSGKRTLDEWNEVAQSVSSLVNVEDYQRCSGVLALSYNHLPSHLKANFLYFGVFPKASEISVKKLIRLWVAEGLLELNGLDELEKVAANILHDLIDKSLVVVSKRSLDGKIKTCRIHDLLHDLCLREGESNGLLYAVNLPRSTRHINVPSQGCRWLSIHSKPENRSPTVLLDDLTHGKTRSFFFLSNNLIQQQQQQHTESNPICPVWREYNNLMQQYKRLGLVQFKLLRVLDLGTLFFLSFPSKLVNLVSLRYLAMVVVIHHVDVPISKLRNLQTLILREPVLLPIDIWGMSQLRHLHSTAMYISSPRKVSANEVKYRILENLQSFRGLRPDCCTKEIFEGIKKVKDLRISGNEEDFCRELRCLDKLKYLHELESLNISVFISYRQSRLFRRLPCLDSFPSNLKKLTLCRTRLQWEDMTIISKLPELEVLQLKADAFASVEQSIERWEVTETGYPKLKFLLLADLRLQYWSAADDYFPRLERVIIKKCRFLQEIPEGFVDSMTLQLIELHQCSPSLVNSAEWIQKEQLESLGSDMLTVYAFDTIKV